MDGKTGMLIAVPFAVLLILVAGCAGGAQSGDEMEAEKTATTRRGPSVEITEESIKRISPADAHKKVKSGEALLVCAYSSEEKCKGMLLEGAITLKELEKKLPTLSRDTEIIFYCA